MTILYITKDEPSRIKIRRALEIHIVDGKMRVTGESIELDKLVDLQILE